MNASKYLTRLLTIVSPEEMTKDPIFAFNPDLPDVSNQHTAKIAPVIMRDTLACVRPDTR